MLKFLRDFKQILTISLISPFLALIKLMMYQSARSFKVLLMLGFVSFGLFFNYADYTDGAEHLERSLLFYNDMSFASFITEAWNIILLRPSLSSEDLYIHFLCFVSNSILGLPKSMHFFASIILGFLVSNTLVAVADKKYFSWNKEVLYLLVIVLYFGFVSLNAIRINTALWLTLFGLVHFYTSKKYSYLLYVIAATQVHIAFYVIGLVPLVGYLLRNRFRFLLLLWLAAPLTPVVPETFLVSVLRNNDLLEEKSNYYVLDENRLAERNSLDISGSRFYKRSGVLMLDSVALPMLMFSIASVYWRRRALGISHVFLAIYLLSHSLTVLFPNIPSLVGRIHNLGNVSLLLGICSIGIKRLEGMYTTKIGVIIFRVVNILNLAALTPIVLLSLSHLLNTTDSYFIIFPLLALVGIEGMGLKDLFY